MAKSGTEILGGWGIWVLIAIYLILLLPITPLLSTYHDDERYYTDAAIIMVQSGDYVTPYYPDGEIRSKKPVLIYWLLSASYALFGINFFASRLPFLLAGCLTLLITYRISIAFFKSELEALTAAAIMAGNTTLFNSSLRSTPDVLLTLFISVSLYGFIAIIFEGKRSILPYCYAYIGAALAVETKGIQGLAPVAFAILFCLIRRGTGIRIHDLIHGKVMAAAVVIAISWYAVILIKHGEAGLTGFVTDQVGNRFSGSKIYILENLVNYVWALARHFFPWSLIFLVGLIIKRRATYAFLKAYRDEILFIFGWYALLFMMFLSGNITRTRYLLPAYPLLAVFFSSLIVHLTRESGLGSFIRGVEGTFLAIGTAGAVLLIFCGIFIDMRILTGGLWLLIISWALWRLSLKRDKLPLVMAIALYMMFVITTVDTFVRPVFRASPVRQLAQCILSIDGQSPSVVSIGMEDKYTGQLRVASAGRVVNVTSYAKGLPQGTTLPDIAKNRILILAEKYKNMVDGPGWRVERCGYSFKALKPGYILEIIKGGDRDAVFEKLKRNYYVAFKE